MRNVIAVVVVPALMLSLNATWAANASPHDEMQPNDKANRLLTRAPQNHMFDGIHLTEQQRQQLRDLMQQARNEHSLISISDLERQYELIIADKFNQEAYQAQAEKIARAEVVRQVEMARIRNQMYHLLTPQQQAVLQQHHQQRLNELRRLTKMQLASPLQAATGTSSTP